MPLIEATVKQKLPECDKFLVGIASECERMWDISGKHAAQQYLSNHCTLKEIRPGLSSKTKLVRRKSLFLIALASPADAVRLLGEMLENDDCPVVRHEAAYFLGTLKVRRALKPLARALDSDEDDLVRHEAAEALGDLGFAEALPVLKRACLSTNRAVRLTAEIACGQLRR
jgi:deoxyhypusine monooxygenase